MAVSKYPRVLLAPFPHDEIYCFETSGEDLASAVPFDVMVSATVLIKR